MAIRIQCESCEASFQVRDEMAGKKGKCPRCGAVFLARPVADAHAGVDSNGEGSSSGSSVAKSKTAGKKKSSVKPPPAPPPVGKLPTGSVAVVRAVEGSLPVGEAVKPVGVKAVSGPRVKAGDSRTGGGEDSGLSFGSPPSALATGRKSAGAEPDKTPKPYRKKGTPVALWAFIGVMGVGSLIGWAVYALRSDEEAPKVAKNDIVEKHDNVEDEEASSKPAESPKKKRSAAKKPSTKMSAKKGAADEESEDEDAADSTTKPKKSATPKIGSPKTGTHTPKGKEEPDSETKIEKFGPAVDNEQPAGADENPFVEEGGTDAPADEAGKQSIAEDIRTLAERCAKFGWHPKAEADYATMAVLADAMMTAEEDVDFEAAAALMNGPINQIVWEQPLVRSIVRYAQPALDAPATGCFLPCEVVAATPVGLLFKLIGTEKHFHVDIEDAAFRTGATPGTKFVVVGVVEPKKGVFQSGEAGAKPLEAAVVASIFFGKINIVDRSKEFGPAE